MPKESSKVAETSQVTQIVVSSRPSFTYIICAETFDGPEGEEKCSVTVDVVENDDGLAEEIVNKTVKDRDSDTYVCSRGHDGKLEIAE